MYPALKDYLNTKLLDPKDFPTTVISYLRIQLDNIRRHSYLGIHKMSMKYFCTMHGPKSFCSFTVLMEKLYTQVILGKSLASKIVTLHKDLQKKMDFFPLIMYKTEYYKRQPVAKLYNDLSDLLSNKRMPDKHSLFVLHTHLLVLHLAESKNKHDNILVSFLQNLNPQMKLTASEFNSTFSLEKCYDGEKERFMRYTWNPLLSSSEIQCIGALFGVNLSKSTKPLDAGKANFNRDTAFYRNLYILYEQLMYLQAFDAQKSMANIITQLLMHDQTFELPFISMVNAQKEINGQLNQLLAEEMKSTDIALNFFDIVQIMTRSLDRFISDSFGFDSYRNVNARITSMARILANATYTTIQERKALSYVSYSFEMNMMNQYHLSMQLINCFNHMKKVKKLKLKLKSTANLCTKIMPNKKKCQQLCQASNMLKEIPKVVNLSRLLHNTAHPPGYTSNGKQIMTISPIPFCMFDKQINRALSKLAFHSYPFKNAKANFGYNFCDKDFQSYTDTGVCTIINVQKGSGQLNEEYNAIPRYGEKRHKLHYPQTSTKRPFEDGIILVLDSWAFNDHVTKKHASESHHKLEYQLLQSEMLNNFNVLLHDHNDFPMMLDQENKIIRLDRDKELASVPTFYTKVKVEVQDADENIRNVEVKKRKCRFEDEIEGLEMFSKYSKDNCLYECRYQLAKEKCQCVPWNFPHKTTDELCDPFGGFCFMRQISWLSLNLNDVENIGSPPCGCYPSCKSYKYISAGQDFVPKSLKWFNTDFWQNKISTVKKNNNVELSKMVHSNRQFLHNYIFAIFYGKSGPLMPHHETLGPMTFFYNESNMPYFASANIHYFKNSSDDLSHRIKNIAILHIDFDRSHYKVRRQIRRTTLANMLSSFGGILGLFLGFSVFGLWDLIFWAMKSILGIFLLKNWKPRDGLGKMKTWMMTVQLSHRKD